VGRRIGQIVVFDTDSGKELQALPINKNIDDLAFDPTSKRLCVACPLALAPQMCTRKQTTIINVWGRCRPDPWEKTGEWEPKLQRCFVAVPQHEGTNTEVLEYRVQ
jgi:hypothetical protein